MQVVHRRTDQATGSISVDQDRRVVLIPWLTLLAGHDSYGIKKHQGIFAGLEYLSDEPSSSEADLTGPAHERRVPDPIKITIPLMAIEQEGYYVGLIWERSSLVAAGFDSPDRVFGSSGHALWLSGPGVGKLRFENDLVAHSPIELRAGSALAVRATILAGPSSSVMGAVQEYVRRRALPGLPDFPGGIDRAVDLLARGWLDSSIHQDGEFKHAEWMGRFKPQPAAGPILFMSWLAQRVPDASWSARLKKGMAEAAARLDEDDPFASGVSHVRFPSPALLLGRVRDYVAQRRSQAWASLGRFDAEGKLVYRPGQVDYSKTHFANHANGMGGQVLAQSLEAATLCADRELISKLLKLLDLQTMLYGWTVPRGAQTWEVPLHTPDILASAHLVRAYVYGYVLTGRQDYLEQARYWAWTGVPFVYLSNPTEGDCGPYATIPVLGATSWKAPVWLGLPVQWCGLVYGSSLHLLSEYDDTGPWKTLAQGITRAGLQMTWPATDELRQGLLPDFFDLNRQVRDGPAINPGTVGARLPEAYDQGKLYQFHRFSNGWFLHAPCAIRDVTEEGGRMTFALDGFGEEPYHILLSGVRSGEMEFQIEPKPVAITRHQEENLVVVQYQGKQRAVVRLH